MELKLHTGQMQRGRLKQTTLVEKLVTLKKVCGLSNSIVPTSVSWP